MNIRITILTLLAATALVPDFFARDYTIPIRIMRRGASTTPVENFELTAEAKGHEIRLREVQPARTDGTGNGTIKFKSDQSPVSILFKVTDTAGDQRSWYVKAFGIYPFGADDDDYSARPGPSATLAKLEAFPEEEIGLAFGEALHEGNTGPIGGAIASIVAPPLGVASDVPVPQPQMVAKALSDRLNVSENAAADMIALWQTKVDASPANTKPDQKSLSALLTGDLVAAGKFAEDADKLTGAEKAGLAALSDTGRLIASVHRITGIAQDAADTIPSPRADETLEELQRTLTPRIPRNPGRMPASVIVPPELTREYSRTVRERAALK